MTRRFSPSSELLYPAVRTDLMRAALTAFGKALNRYPPGDRKRFQKAETAVLKAVETDWRNQRSYLARCHGFRNLTKNMTQKSIVTAFGEWLIADANGLAFNEAFMDAVAIAPMRGRGTRFLKSDFVAAVRATALGGQEALNKPLNSATQTP